VLVNLRAIATEALSPARSNTFRDRYDQGYGKFRPSGLKIPRGFSPQNSMTF